jgi:hypothetical protein
VPCFGSKGLHVRWRRVRETGSGEQYAQHRTVHPIPPLSCAYPEHDAVPAQLQSRSPRDHRPSRWAVCQR